MGSQGKEERAWQRVLLMALPGALLATIVLGLVLILAQLDAWQPAFKSGSLQALMTPDPFAAAGTLGLVGGALSVAIGIVLIVVVFGIQTTASRYSPRIIELFISDPVNVLALGLFLGAIALIFMVRAKIKPDYVPMFGVVASVILGWVGLAILLPYVAYMFEVMRAETLIQMVLWKTRRRMRRKPDRPSLRKSVAQISDIGLGSLEHADVPVCLAAVEALRRLLIEVYLPLKPGLPAGWFDVSRDEMPGTSEEVLALVRRTRTWLEHTVLSFYLDLIGQTPAFRREIVHMIASATGELGVAAMKASDTELEEQVVRFFNTYLRTALHQRTATFAYPLMHEYRRLAELALETHPSLTLEISEHLLAYGRSFETNQVSHVVGAAAEEVAEIASRAVHDGRSDQALAIARLLARSLTEMVAAERPAGAIGAVMKPVVKLTLHCLSDEHRELASVLLAALGQAPRDLVERALRRLEGTRIDVYYEVGERVVAFDWVEEELRLLIPALRTRLEIAGNGAAAYPGSQPVISPSKAKL